jgi:hypothetical protein
MIESKKQPPPEGALDLMIQFSPPPNDGDTVSAPLIACGGIVTPGQAVTATLFNPVTGKSSSSTLAAGSFEGNMWSTSLSVDAADFPGPSQLQAQVDPPDGPVAFIMVNVVP